MKPTGSLQPAVIVHLDQGSALSTLQVPLYSVALRFHSFCSGSARVNRDSIIRSMVDSWENTLRSQQNGPILVMEVSLMHNSRP